MIHALIKTTRTTAFALRRHTHTTAEVVELGREDWCENFVHTIPIHNDTSNTRNIHTQTENTSGHTHVHTVRYLCTGIDLQVSWSKWRRIGSEKHQRKMRSEKSCSWQNKKRKKKNRQLKLTLTEVKGFNECCCSRGKIYAWMCTRLRMCMRVSGCMCAWQTSFTTVEKKKKNNNMSTTKTKMRTREKKKKKKDNKQNWQYQTYKKICPPT